MKIELSKFAVVGGGGKSAKSRRSCGISKRSGKIPVLDFSTKRLFPRPFYPQIVLQSPLFVTAFFVQIPFFLLRNFWNHGIL
jgi:hypothetical protein